MAFDKLRFYLGKARYFLICCGVLIGAVVIVSGMHALKPKPEKEENERPPLVVRTVDAVLKEQKVSSTFQGEVRAKTNIELVTQVTGKVMSVSDKFIEGGHFQPGEALVQIDDSDYQVALKSAQAMVASAQVDLDMERARAATNEREWRDLQNRPIEQANPLRLNKPQVDRAIAQLDAAKAELAAAKLNYDRTKISAPFAGRIMTKTAELGQFMARGASVGRVFATDAMEVRIPMTDVQVDELGLTLGYTSSKSGQTSLAATVSAVFGIERHYWQGYLKSVDANIDNQTRLLYATVVVDSPFLNGGLQTMPLAPGLFVDVSLESSVALKGIEIPRTALRNGEQVYVMEGSSLRIKPVEVIYTSNDVVIVNDNEHTKLSASEPVITSSVPGAYEGMPITLSKEAEEQPEPEFVEPNSSRDSDEQDVQAQS